MFHFLNGAPINYSSCCLFSIMSAICLSLIDLIRLVESTLTFKNPRVFSRIWSWQHFHARVCRTIYICIDIFYNTSINTWVRLCSVFELNSTSFLSAFFWYTQRTICASFFPTSFLSIIYVIHNVMYNNSRSFSVQIFYWNRFLALIPYQLPWKQNQSGWQGKYTTPIFNSSKHNNKTIIKYI